MFGRRIFGGGPARHALNLRAVRGLIRSRLWAQILIAMMLGLTAGALLAPTAGSPFALEMEMAELAGAWLRLPGSIFLNLIQMVVIGLISTSIVLGITATGDARMLGRAAGRIVPYFLVTTTIAVAIGATLATLVGPGHFVDPSAFLDTESADALAASVAEMSGNGAAPAMAVEAIPEEVASIIPANLSSAVLSRNMFQIVIAATLGGVALATLGAEKAKPLITLIQLVQEVSLVIVGWAMRLAPVAVFGLICDFVMRTGLSALLGLSVYIGCVLGGLVVLLGVYLVIVAVLGRRNPLTFLGQGPGAQLLAFSTSSSAATMPLSLRIAEERLDVRPAVTRFIIPLGATVNMDGTALYQTVAAVFMIQLFQVDLDTLSFIVLAVTVIGASIGSPSTPGVGIVILASVLASVGIPAEGVAILLGVDRILDMCRTSVNVTGDLVACTVMDRWLPAPSGE